MAVRVELGPSAMILESGVERMWSISSRNGVQMRGKAETHGVAMPMRCTPWPEQGVVSDEGLVENMGFQYQGRRGQSWVEMSTLWNSIL